MLVGVTALTPSGGDPWPWWSPFTYLQVLALAGGFAWLLKFVFVELFYLFGWYVALTGLYSTQIIALGVVWEGVEAWFHLPRGSSAGVRET